VRASDLIEVGERDGGIVGIGGIDEKRSIIDGLRDKCLVYVLDEEVVGLRGHFHPLIGPRVHAGVPGKVRHGARVRGEPQRRDLDAELGRHDLSEYRPVERPTGVSPLLRNATAAACTGRMRSTARSPVTRPSQPHTAPQGQSNRAQPRHQSSNHPWMGTWACTARKALRRSSSRCVAASRSRSVVVVPVDRPAGA
jgi:hypothetical protein